MPSILLLLYFALSKPLMSEHLFKTFSGLIADLLCFSIPEYTKLEFIKEIGWTHMRVLEGVGTLIQLGGLMARLCKM